MTLVADVAPVGNGSSGRGGPLTQPSEAVYSLLGSTPDGLTAAEATRRLAQVGPNELAAAERRSLVLEFLANLYQVFALLLWVSAVLAFVSGAVELGWAIIGVILINALFSFYQEYQAERAIDALRELLPARARVLRDGQELTILARELVPGDVMLIEEGDRISADARLVQAFALRTIHATLTGESEPVPRQSDPSLTGPPSWTRPTLCSPGTSVAHGRGTAVVLATGMSHAVRSHRRADPRHQRRAEPTVARDPAGCVRDRRAGRWTRGGVVWRGPAGRGNDSPAEHCLCHRDDHRQRA